MANPEQVSLEKFRILMKEGDPAPNFYALLTGKVAVFRHRKFVKAISGRGAFVGEMGALLGSKRSATVITLDASTLMPIPNNVEKMFLHRPDIGMKLLENLRRRLSETYDRAVKVWEKFMDDITEIVIYEAASKSVSKKNTPLSEVEAERNSIRQIVLRELKSENFHFLKLNDFLKTMDADEEVQKHIKEKHPKFKYVDLTEMRDLWKKRIPDETPKKLAHCSELATGLDQLTNFCTSLGVQDEATGSEEIDMLESCVLLPRRITMFKSVAQNALTAKQGIDKMKMINRDIDTEVEEAERVEKRTGRIFHLTDFAKKIGIGNEYINELRNEFWNVCLKM